MACQDGFVRTQVRAWIDVPGVLPLKQRAAALLTRQRWKHLAQALE
jgi:hypothetical protein